MKLGDDATMEQWVYHMNALDRGSDLTPVPYGAWAHGLRSKKCAGVITAASQLARGASAKELSARLGRSTALAVPNDMEKTAR